MDLCEIPEGEFQRHPWNVARLRFFVRELRSCGALDRCRQMLDVGASDGWFSGELAKEMSPAARITCLDPYYTDEQLKQFNARGGSQSFVRGVPEEQFDLLLLLDVLEHVEHDALFLRELVAHLAPGALVLFTVPAWPQLYSDHDRHLRHFRRYSPTQGETVLRGAGLEIERRGGLFHSLLAARGLQLLREKVVPTKNEPVADHQGTWQHGRVLSWAVRQVLIADNAVSRTVAHRGVDLPGLSWWALCRKTVL